MKWEFSLRLAGLGAKAGKCWLSVNRMGSFLCKMAAEYTPTNRDLLGTSVARFLTTLPSTIGARRVTLFRVQQPIVSEG